MTLNVLLDLPAEVELRVRQGAPDLEQHLKRVVLIELFRRGTLTHFELARALGTDRAETDAYLKQQGIFEGSLTSEDLEADRVTVQRLTESSP